MYPGNPPCDLTEALLGLNLSRMTVPCILRPHLASIYIVLVPQRDCAISQRTVMHNGG